jgi:hypothetical protein
MTTLVARRPCTDDDDRLTIFKTTVVDMSVFKWEDKSVSSMISWTSISV